MFTINIYLKFALIAIFLGGGLVLTFLSGYGLMYSWPLLLIGLIFLASYIFLGTIQSAAQMVQTMDFEGAEKRLGLTLNPKWLYVTNRAFYYIIKGSMAMNLQKQTEAETYFNQALDLKLPSENERGMVLLQLANINASKGKWTAAKNYFREVKKMKITEGQLKNQVTEFEKALNQQGQMKSAQMGNRRGQMQPGGKRRRPKMR